MRRLEGRVCVVTGGASGIGLASARRLASEGARVVVADVDEAAGARAADEVGGLFVRTDVTSEADVEALFAAAAERGVAFVKGTDFLLEGGRNTLRLAYSGVTVDEIDEGVARLAEAYRSAGVPAG